MSHDPEDDRIWQLLIRVLAEPPDPAILTDATARETVRSNAKRFGITAAVAFALRPHVPPGERVWCDQQLIRSWTGFGQSLRDLESVLGILEEKGIQTVCLKGPVLALRHYQPPFIRRPPVDFDLAIRAQDLERTCEALQGAGYVLRAPIEEAKAGGHDVPLLHVSRPRIELHFRLSHSAFGLPIEEFIDRALSYTLPSGRSIWILEPADELLHLTLHLASDRFSGFFHLYELRRLWKAAPEEVRRETVKRAVSRRCSGIFALVQIGFRLHFDEEFLPPGSELPDTWLQWRVNESLYRSFEGWFASDPDKKLGSRLRARWLDLQVTDSPADALRWINPLARLVSVRLRGRQWGAMRPVRNASSETTPLPPRGEDRVPGPVGGKSRIELP